MTLERVPCDLCGHQDFAVLFPGSIPVQVDPADYYSSSRKKAGHLDIVRCTNCGLVRTNPRDDPATLKSVYASLQDTSYQSERRNRLRSARERIKRLSKWQPHPARLLDVGCATGLFVCEAAQRGWKATGLEASEWAIQQARERCPQAQFIPGMLEEADIPPESFEVVTMWDVLEHVRSPTETLRRVHGWLVKQGILTLNLPNIESRVARRMGSRWVLFLREHLWYFSPQTLQALFEKTGFSLLEVRPNFVRFSVENIFSRLAQYPGVFGKMAARGGAFRAWQHLSLKFPIGEMVVTARKE